VVPVPPLIGRRLWIAFRRVFPVFLPTQWGNVQVIPGAAHLFIAAIIEKIGSEYLAAISIKDISAVPFIHTEISIEAVCDGEPWDIPAHACFQADNVGLGRARQEYKGGIASIEMGKMRHLIRHH